MLSLNGVDLSTLGVECTGRTLPSPGGERSVIIPVPGARGGVRVGAQIEPGTLVVEGAWNATDHATAIARRDALAAALQGPSTIRFSDYPDREWVGWMQQGASRADLLDPAWAARDGTFTLEFTLPDPTAQARNETVIAAGAALVLGSAPSPLRIETNGSAVTVRVLAGATVLRELVWTGASGAVVIDATDSTITVNGANAIKGHTPASMFPVADPRQGANSVYVSTGGTVRYRRRWW